MSIPRAAFKVMAGLVVALPAAVAVRGQSDSGAVISPRRSEQSAPAQPRERLVSPRVAALLSAALPQLPPPAPDGSPVLVRVAPAVEQTGNGIVRLPNFVVRESKPPPFAEVERHEIARRAMEKYLGPEDGFDRGFLNLITAKQFPLLALFGSVSNEARAMGRYREDERLRLKADLLELATLAKLSGDAAGGKKLQHETQQLFRRE